MSVKALKVCISFYGKERDSDLWYLYSVLLLQQSQLRACPHNHFFVFSKRRDHSYLLPLSGDVSFSINWITQSFQLRFSIVLGYSRVADGSLLPNIGDQVLLPQYCNPDGKPRDSRTNDQWYCPQPCLVFRHYAFGNDHQQILQ